MSKTFRKQQSEKKIIGAKSAKKTMRNRFQETEIAEQMRVMRGKYGAHEVSHFEYFE